MRQQRRRFETILPAALLVALAGCTAIPQADQPTTSAPPPPPSPVTPPAPMTTQSWEERKFDGGAWRYDAASRTAIFAAANAPTLSLRCAGGSIQFITDRFAAAGRPLAVDLKTHSGTARLRFEPQGAHGSMLALPVNDSRLDQIAFSRGRFALDASNGRALTLPVHSEIGRMIEDCRG